MRLLQLSMGHGIQFPGRLSASDYSNVNAPLNASVLVEGLEKQNLVQITLERPDGID